MRPLVIYHGGCRDGFCAAWVCSEAMRDENPEFFAGYYGQNPPDARGRKVVIVDFSYPLIEMRKIADEAESLLVLDHHKTAQAALSEMAANPPANTRIVFNMEQSGAGLAWSCFFPDRPRPYLVDYVEDRDLWLHSLPNSRQANAYIGTIPFDFDSWTVSSHMDLSLMVEMGYAVESKIKQYVAEVRKNARRVTFEGHDIPIVNAPQVDISELLHDLCQGEAFAMGWWQRSDGEFQYSLRSVGDFDVSELAKRHGGGGHKNAAGFESATMLQL